MAFDFPSNFTLGNETISVVGIGSLFQYAQYATGNWFGMALIFLIWLIAFLPFSLVGFAQALAASSFIAFIFSLYLIRLDMIHPAVPFILIAMTILGAIISKERRSGF